MPNQKFPQQWTKAYKITPKDHNILPRTNSKRDVFVASYEKDRSQPTMSQLVSFEYSRVWFKEHQEYIDAKKRNAKKKIIAQPEYKRFGDNLEQTRSSISLKRPKGASGGKTESETSLMRMGGSYGDPYDYPNFQNQFGPGQSNANFMPSYSYPSEMPMMEYPDLNNGMMAEGGMGGGFPQGVPSMQSMQQTPELPPDINSFMQPSGFMDQPAMFPPSNHLQMMQQAPFMQSAPSIYNSATEGTMPMHSQEQSFGGNIQQFGAGDIMPPELFASYMQNPANFG